MPRVLVTGVNGFVGGHLARALADAGAEVAGIIKETELNPNVRPLVKQSITCDLVDRNEVGQIDFSAYAAIIHLAGLANVGESYENSQLYMKVNVEPLINICEALIEQKAPVRIIAISTGAVYDSHQPMPLKESSKLVKNGSPYAQSKIAMEQKTNDYANKGLDCIIVRPFNHIGPGQARGFIVPDMYYKLTQAVKTGAPVKTGDLTTRRDYTDVRDVVRAYTLLALAEAKVLTSRVYNVCSSTARSGEEIVNEIKRNVPGSAKLKTEVDPALIRPNDPKELKGSNELIKKDIGWSPVIPFEQTIKDALV